MAAADAALLPFSSAPAAAGYRRMQTTKIFSGYPKKQAVFLYLLRRVSRLCKQIKEKCGEYMPKFQKKALVPWLSATSDGKDGRFIQIGNSLLLSKMFQELSTGAVHLYMCMAMESGGHWDFKFPLKAAKKYGIASTSLRRYITELERGGFIIVRSNKNLRIANDYRFSVEWKKRSPAT